MGRRLAVGAATAVVAVAVVSKKYGGSLEKEAVVELARGVSERLGMWTIPLYVMVHTLSIALCLPYAVFMEAAASLLFGFFPGVACVFSAKILGASLSFFIGRALFRSSSSLVERVQRNKYFHLISRGVERDGWKFVLLARFSPIPSYVINYALAATKVGFFVDFLLPTLIGGLPMILQNTSIGSLAGAAVSSTTGSQKSKALSYLLPMLGIVSSVLISLRIKKYSSEIVADSNDNVDSTQMQDDKTNQMEKKK